MTKAVHRSRREFMQHAGGLAGAAALGLGTDALFAAVAAVRKNVPRTRVAAVFTELRFRSHAFNILENFLEPYVFNGKKADSGMDVVSFYADQFPENDMARDVSRRYQIPLYKTIAEAVCCGGKDLAVDAVLLIGEHGEYSFNELEQHQYPRKEFYDEIVKVVEASGRAIPIFNDKHLSYRWDWAKEMYDRAKRLGIPFMAGSSVPLAQRIPALELPLDAKITEALAIHGGGVESYDFHGLEILQSLVESRKGGESGVTRVQFVEGAALQKAADEGRWSPALMQAALDAEAAARAKPLEPADSPPAHGILIEYKDGLRGTVLKIGTSSVRWNVAVRIAGEADARATHFYVGPWGNRNLFMALSHAIQHLFREKQTPYSLERTLLTTGVVEAAMRSRHQSGIALDTPHLAIGYRPIDFRSFRETGESWKVITEKSPEPKEILAGGVARLIED